MERAHRTQHDDLQDKISDASGIDCSTEPDTTRQEFKDEADTNVLLKRFGVGIPLKPVVYGETHFDIDLQQALEAVNQARTAYRGLPPELKRIYPSWQTLLNAIESGALILDTTKNPDTTVPPVTEPKQD